MFSGQVAVITGGSGGIGRASAERWIAEGGKVVCADINVKSGRAFEASQPAGVVRFVKVDTRRRSDVEEAIRVAKEMGRFSLMFCNAGVGVPTDNLSQALDDWDTLMRLCDINIRACCLGAMLALRSFPKEHGGTIITTASMAGLLPVGAPPLYSMSKAANIHFTRAVAGSLSATSKIRIYALCPSYTATAMGPPVEQIKAALGGVLTAAHQAEGFMLLASRSLPNGSVMRVTARRGGTRVVHDLVTYGKELGGSERPRPGMVIKDEPLGAYTGPMDAHVGGVDVSRLSSL